MTSNKTATEIVIAKACQATQRLGTLPIPLRLEALRRSVDVISAALGDLGREMNKESN